MNAASFRRRPVGHLVFPAFDVRYYGDNADSWFIRLLPLFSLVMHACLRTHSVGANSKRGRS